MITKNYNKAGRTCRVTFAVAPNGTTEWINLCGEFNGWDKASHPMAKRKDGRFTTTITLTAGQSYRFRYLLDGNRWENDEAADAYKPNQFGSDDSVVTV